MKYLAIYRSIAAAMTIGALVSACGGGTSDASAPAEASSSTATAAVDTSTANLEEEARRRKSAVDTTSTTTATSSPSTSTTTQSGTTSSTTLSGNTTAWTLCAQEYGTCSFSGTRNVKYGIDTSVVVLSATGSIACDNSAFGDPAVGATKSCWYDSTTSNSTTLVSTASTASTATTSTTTTATAPATTQNAPLTVTATGPTTSASFSSTNTDFPNPERGWYFSAGSLLDTSSFEAGLGYLANGTTGITSEKLKLAFSYTTLPQANLSSSQLSAIGNSLTAARNRGMKVIVRFIYCNSSSSCEPSLSQVLAHTAQLKQYLYANRDVIAQVQAGLIGQYGEWVASSSGLDVKASKRAVKDAVLDMTPPEISVQFTQMYPIMEDWFASQGPLSLAEAFTGTSKSRVGFHNDCFLTGNGDSSTYPGPQTIIDFLTSTTEAQKRAYVAAASEYVPFGGETCNNSQGAAAQMRTACSGSTDGIGQSGGILNEGPRYHLSYLNRGFATNFHDAWTAGGCYATVARNMGYRIQLDSVSHQAAVSRGQTISVNVNLRNVGWARIFSARPLVVTIVNGSTVYTAKSTTDLRQLPSQASSSTTIPVNITIPAGAPTGAYSVYLSAPDIYSTTADDARQAVRFANADSGAQTWNASTARFSTGTTLSVQ